MIKKFLDKVENSFSTALVILFVLAVIVAVIIGFPLFIILMTFYILFVVIVNSKFAWLLVVLFGIMAVVRW